MPLLRLDPDFSLLGPQIGGHDRNRLVDPRRRLEHEAGHCRVVGIGGVAKGLDPLAIAGIWWFWMVAAPVLGIAFELVITAHAKQRRALQLVRVVDDRTRRRHDLSPPGVGRGIRAQLRAKCLQQFPGDL